MGVFVRKFLFLFITILCCVPMESQAAIGNRIMRSASVLNDRSKSWIYFGPIYTGVVCCPMTFGLYLCSLGVLYDLTGVK
jgi:hypothetical protein